MNMTEINKKYQALHDALGKQCDAPDIKKFDDAHRKVWDNYKKELEARKVELEEKPSLTKEELTEVTTLKFILC